MIRASGAGGPGFDSRTGPFLLYIRTTRIGCYLDKHILEGNTLPYDNYKHNLLTFLNVNHQDQK